MPTTEHGLPFPSLSSPNNPPYDIQILAEAIDQKLETTNSTLENAIHTAKAEATTESTEYVDEKMQIGWRACTMNGTNFTGSVYVYWIGNLCWLQTSGVSYKSNLAAGAELMLCTLPDTCKPSMNIYAPIFLGNATAASATIYKSGEVKIWTPADGTTNNLTGKALAINACWAYGI